MTRVSGRSAKDRFDLSNQVAVVTGGAGLLGVQHAMALSEFGASVVLLDIDADRVNIAAQTIEGATGGVCIGLAADIRYEASVDSACAQVMDRFGRVDVLVNNASRNPAVGAAGLSNTSRLEAFPVEEWNLDIAVGLTGAFLCSRTFGARMASSGGGSIINIASDLGLIAPDQRLYARPDAAPEEQPVKPVTYSVVKAGLIGLTRYLATYWPDKGVRANALAPGGVQVNQGADFLERIEKLIPMGRMARPDEYRAAVVFLASDASSYMTGAVLPIDGGRTAW